jgi:hypothetical protein
MRHRTLTGCVSETVVGVDGRDELVDDDDEQGDAGASVGVGEWPTLGGLDAVERCQVLKVGTARSCLRLCMF